MQRGSRAPRSTSRQGRGQRGAVVLGGGRQVAEQLHDLLRSAEHPGGDPEEREDARQVPQRDALGVAIDLAGIDSMKALIWSAMLNGVVAVPIMAVMMLLASNPGVMGRFVVSRRLKLLGWFAVAVMAAAVCAVFVLI